MDDHSSSDIADIAALAAEIGEAATALCRKYCGKAVISVIVSPVTSEDEDKFALGEVDIFMNHSTAGFDLIAHAAENHANRSTKEVVGGSRN